MHLCLSDVFLGFGCDCSAEGKRVLPRGHERCLFDVFGVGKERGRCFGGSLYQ